MRIVIAASQSDALENSSARNQISEICDYVSADQGDSQLIPQPGKLMDLIRILKEHGIPYRIHDVPPNHKEAS